MTQHIAIQIFGVTLSPWLCAPIIFIVWLMMGYTLKGLLSHRLGKWGEKTKTRWDQFLIKTLNLPLNVLILSAGLVLLERLLPLPETLHAPMILMEKALVIIAIFLFLDQFVLQLLDRFGKRVGGIDISRGILHEVIRLSILSFGLLMLLDALGISITPLVASLGIGSLAIALGLQDTLANIFAGLYIVADQPIVVGDFIKLESGEQGYVKEIGWRNTRILMLSNIMVVVPNNKVISSTIHNYYRPDKEIAVLVEVGVHDASDLEKVERVTAEVGRQIQKEVQGAVPEFEPFIRYHTFGESGIHFTAILRAREFADQYLIKHQFIKALQQRYQKEGIVIPYPTRSLDISSRTLDELKSCMSRNNEANTGAAGGAGFA